jgi:tetratricopeptide (TPR) repeat protein
MGDLSVVEEHANATLELARRLGRADLESRSVSDLAHVRTEDDPDEALRLFEEALRLASESESLEARGNVLVRRSQLELEQGRHRDARASAEEAVAAFREIGSTDQIGWALAALGEVLLDDGDVDGAEATLREAHRLLAPLRQRGNLVEAQRQLAEVMLARGRVAEAERYALAATETVGRDDAWSRALTLSTLALVRSAQGRDAEAEALLREALAAAQATTYRNVELERLAALAEFLRERGRLDEAEPLDERYADLSPTAETSAARIA